MTAIVLRGDARELPLPDTSVDLIVTSPPFYGLRDCRLAMWRTTDPAERAKAMQVPKPPPVPDGQMDLFGLEAS